MISLETATRGINTVLIIGSAALTGVFGYTFGGQSVMLGAVFFLIFCALSLLVPVLWEYAGRQARTRNYKVAWVAAFFGLIFFVYDVATNFGTGALFRESEMVSAENTNNIAGDARSEIVRIEKRVSEIRGQTAWQTTYLAPAAYDSLIEAAQLIRDNEERRGGCGRLCEQKTKELAELEANKANALERQAMKDEMVTLERELVEAKAKSADSPTVASAAISHARNAGAFMTGTMAPGAETLFWANYGLTFAAALACSLAGAVTSLLLGWMAPPHRRDQHDEDWDYGPPQRLSYHGPRDDDYGPQRGPEPTPLKPAPARARDRETSTETVIVSTHGLPVGSSENPDIKELLQRSQEAAAKARKMLEEMKTAGRA